LSLLLFHFDIHNAFQSTLLTMETSMEIEPGSGLIGHGWIIFENTNPNGGLKCPISCDIIMLMN
jgi:hypothetical protein